MRAVLCCLLAVALPAQEPGATVYCKSCFNLGTFACKQHGSKAQFAKEEAVLFCSVVADCKACSGALKVDCRTCANPTAEAELAARIKVVQEWRQQRKTKVEDVARGQQLLHIKTTHLDLSYGIKPLTVGKEKIDTHAGMHLYAERIEALRTLFLETLGANEREQAGRLEVYMHRDEQGHLNLAPVTTGVGGNGASGVKLMGMDSVYCMWHDLRNLPDDDSLHRSVIHNVTHLLLSNLNPVNAIFNKGHGWVDEGLAHWFEDKITGKCTNFCFEEVLMQSGASFKGGRWRAPVRRMVDEGKLTSFPQLMVLNTDQLDFPQHAQSFALVDYLLTAHGGSKFKTFLCKLKAGEATRDALQAVYGTNPLALDTEFQTWVKANYSPLEPPR